MPDPWKGTKLTHSFFQTNRNKYLVLKVIEWRIPVKIMYLFGPGADLSCLYNSLSLNCSMDRIENIPGTAGNKKWTPKGRRPGCLGASVMRALGWALQWRELMLVTQANLSPSAQQPKHSCCSFSGGMSPCLGTAELLGAGVGCAPHAACLVKAWGYGLQVL